MGRHCRRRKSLRYNDIPKKKKRRGFLETPSQVIATVIILMCVGVCGLLLINFPKARFFPKEESRVATESLSANTAETKNADETASYALQETEKLNEDGTVSDKYSKSKLMEELVKEIVNNTNYTD